MMQSAGIGIDIGGTSIKYGLVGLNKEIYWKSEKPTKASTSSKQVVENILEAVVETINEAEKLNINVKSVGIGTPGLVKDNNIIIGGADNITDWVNVPLGNIISKKVNLPTYVGNDADMMGMGEFSVSQSAPNDTVLFITLGTGIGGAIFINGKLFNGHYGLGGELGVLPLIVDNKLYYWEDVASTSAMVRFYKEASTNKNEKIDGKQIIAKYFEGDLLAIEVIEKTTNFIGMGLAGYVNIFNPKKIVIGGGVSQAGDFFIEKIKQYTRKYVLAESFENVEIQAASLGNNAGFIGASLFALNICNQN